MPVLLPPDAGARPDADGLRAAGLAAGISGGRHRGQVGGILRLDARWLWATVPVSCRAEDRPGVGGILERVGGAALSGWTPGTLHNFGQWADHLRCPGESTVRATELKAGLSLGAGAPDCGCRLSVNSRTWLKPPHVANTRLRAAKRDFRGNWGDPRVPLCFAPNESSTSEGNSNCDLPLIGPRIHMV